MLDRVVSSGLCKQQCSILSTSLHFATTAESFCVFFFGEGEGMILQFVGREILGPICMKFYAPFIIMPVMLVCIRDFCPLEETGMNTREQSRDWDK